MRKIVARGVEAEGGGCVPVHRDTGSMRQQQIIGGNKNTAIPSLVLIGDIRSVVHNF